MSERTRHLVAVFGTFTVVLALCLGAVVFVGGRGSGTAAIQPASVGGPFDLTDQDGKPFSDKDLKGKSFLVFFGFTHCPDVCPTTLFEISEVLRNLGPEADRTAALFISVDPERDTPEAMRSYLGSFDPHIHGLTGDAAAVAAVTKAYRVYYKKVPLDGGDYTMDHTAIVYLMDKDGRFVAPLNMRRTVADTVADLRKYL
jgi:protein SCO1